MTLATPDYGRDIYLGNDLDPLMRETVGLETLVLALWHRLDTPRGTLLDDPDYGISFVDLLSQAQTPQGLASIPATVRDELSKDERVNRESLRVAATYAAEIVRLHIVGYGAEGPFELSVDIGKAGPKLLASNPSVGGT